MVRQRRRIRRSMSLIACLLVAQNSGDLFGGGAMPMVVHVHLRGRLDRRGCGGSCRAVTSHRGTGRG